MKGRAKSIHVFLAVFGIFAAASFFSPAYVEAERSRSAGAEFVFDAYDILRRDFYDQERIDLPVLLNAALTGLSVAFEGKDVLFVFDEIPMDIAPEGAKKWFVAEFYRARKLARRIGQFEDNELAFAATDAMLNSLHSSHTFFLTPQEYEASRIRECGLVVTCGIGIEIRKEDDLIYIHRVYADSPADRAGLLRLDVIVAVNGEEVGDDLEYISSRVRGERGKSVDISVKRGIKGLTYTIFRDDIVVKDIEKRIVSRGSHNILYIHLSGFAERFVYRVRGALLAHKYDAVIFDLRDNHGGLLWVLEAISGFFLRGDTELFVEITESGERGYFIDELNVALTKVPLAVLINNSSASASEIFASAVQEAKRGVVLGETSSGAVEVSYKYELDFGAGMGVAICEVLTSSGKKIEGVGVTPDIEVKLEVEDIIRGEDVQLTKAIEAVIELVEKNKK